MTDLHEKFMRMKNKYWLLVICVISLFSSCIKENSNDLNLLKGTHLFPMRGFEKKSNYSYYGQYVYINEKGEVAFDKKFDDAYPFFDGLAKVIMNKKCYFIDEKGEVVIDASEYRNVSHFSEGVAWAVGKTIANETFAIDKTGKVLFQLNGRAESFFYEGLAAFRLDKYGPIGFVNTKGEVVIEPKFHFPDIYRFVNGLVCVGDENTRTFGAINTKGELVIDYQFNKPFMFDQNGCAVVYVGDNQTGTYGLINGEGKFLIELGTYRSMENDGKWYRVSIDGERCGWCDKNGEMKIEPCAENDFSQSSFNGDKWALAQIDGKKSFIDSKGKVILTTQYEVVSSFIGDVCIVKSLGYQLMNRQGELVGEERYDKSVIEQSSFSIYWSKGVHGSFSDFYR